MAAYTERFVAVSAAAIGQSVVFTVPAGKRAVVQTVTFADRAGVANLCRLRILSAGDDPFIAIRNLAAGTGAEITNLRTALYAGDQVEFYRGAAADITVSGYLFDDPA